MLTADLKDHRNSELEAYSAPGTKSRHAAGRRRVAILVLGACLLIAAAVAFAIVWRTRSAGVPFPTRYQAVLLSNGAVYYGELHGYGSQTPLLTDAFYVVSRTDPNTKTVTNVLVRRGKELHGPDRMYINPNSIVFVETVGSGSKVAQLIAEASH